MEKLRFFTREHRGGLKESLETTKEISKEQFKTLLPKYKFYCYDDRVNQVMFITKKYSDYLKQPFWLVIGTKRDIETYLNTND